MSLKLNNNFYWIIIAFVLLETQSCFPFKDYPEIPITEEYHLQDQSKQALLFRGNSLISEEPFTEVHQSESHLICLNEYRFYIIELLEKQNFNFKSNKEVSTILETATQGPYSIALFNKDSIKTVYKLQNTKQIFPK